MVLQLYGRQQSSSTERVRIALALKGLSCETISVDDIGWDAYERINPQRLVPTLSVGDQLIPQSNAILHYLDEQFPELPLLPGDPVLRAQSRSFAQYISCEMHAVDIRRVRKYMQDAFALDQPHLDRWSDHWFTQGFTRLEAMLRGRSTIHDFCYGDRPGWAEVHLVPHMRKGVTRFNLDRTAFPLLSAIFDKCIDQPAFVAAAPRSVG